MSYGELMSRGTNVLDSASGIDHSYGREKRDTGVLILAKLVIYLISKIFLTRRWNIDLCSFKWDCFSDSSSSSGWKIDFFVFAPHYHLCQISVCTSVEPKPQVLLTKRVHPLWQNCVAKQIYSFYAARGEDLKFIWTLAILPQVVVRHN